MKHNVIIALIAVLMLPSFLMAEDNANRKEADKKYQFGFRSGIILGHMNLSNLNPSFSDLKTDGEILKSAHHSSVFLLTKIKPWLSLGVESLVGNSDEDGGTTMDFQGGGIVADLHHGRKFFFGGGLHLGGIIVDAMKRDSTAGNNTFKGTFYKSSGLFSAPYAGVGMKLRKVDIFVFVKRLMVFNLDKKREIDAFSSTYAGASLAWNL